MLGVFEVSLGFLKRPRKRMTGNMVFGQKSCSALICLNFRPENRTEFCSEIPPK